MKKFVKFIRTASQIIWDDVKESTPYWIFDLVVLIIMVIVIWKL
jgi:hypothetical protein